MKIRVVVPALACLAPSLVLAQRLTKETIYFGGTGGIATLSGDANAVITASSASTSSYDPSNGGAAEAFIGAHIFDYLPRSTTLRFDPVICPNDQLAPLTFIEG